MRNKFIKVTLAVCVLCITSPCFAAGAGGASVGVNNIGTHEEYLSSMNGGIRYNHSGSWWINGSCTYQIFGKGTKNFIDDIKGAILDQNRFDFALSENRFFDAWRMGGETEQGVLWKSIAMGKTRERVSQLVTRSILEDNPDKMAEAVAISALFPDPIRADLTAFIEAETAGARAVHAGLAPETAARLVALRSISDRLFG